MNTEPNSRLWLCTCNLENDYKNTLTFASKEAQRNYFIGDPNVFGDTGISRVRFSEFTYLRKEKAIDVYSFVEDIETNNYLVLINDEKYFYYFITSMEYMDDQVTRIHIELDVMQTYFFDIEYKQTFVEREHVTDDTAGNHTIPEGLETGDYMGSTDFAIEESNVTNIVMQIIYDPDKSWPTLNCQYGGVFSGTLYVVADIENATKIIQIHDKMGQRDYIVSVFMYRGTIASGGSYTMSYGGISANFDIVQTSSSCTIDDYTLSATKPTKVGTYTPRNKKLLTYPYIYLLANNMAGGSKAYKYEYFSDQGIKFGKFSTICVGGSVIYAPKGYKPTSTASLDYNYNEAIIGAKFPVCSWSSDSYTNWLTQSSVNREYAYKKDVGQILIGAGTMGMGALTGNVPMMMLGATTTSGGIGSGINDIINNMQSKEEHLISPMELQGLASAGDVVWGLNGSKLIFTNMFIREEYAKIIDKFFDMFGYKVNVVKTPSIHTRTNWNYLKTQSCNFTGDIPQEYMLKIKNIFDNGITFWHNPSTMFNYSLSNGNV